MKVALLTTDSREFFGDYANPQPAFGTAPEALLQGFAETPELEIHVVSCTRQPMISPEKLAPNIWYHALHVPKSGWMRTGYLGCIRAVRARLAHLRPDIVHGQGTERDCALSAVLCGFPNVVTIHGNMLAIEAFNRTGQAGLFHWCAARLETFALRRTAGVFCNSAYTEALVARRAQKTWRVPNPLRLAFFSPPAMPAPTAPPVLLNVGVISPRKRQLEILGLAAQLHARGHRFCLQFLGVLDAASAYGREFLAALQSAEAAGYARHLGSLEGAALMACFDSAAALLHFPSEESFGLVVAEGLARNLKLFAARLGGIIDIAGGVEGAELFTDGDWETARVAVERWLAAGAPRPTHAAAEMATRYHPRAVAAQHATIYREALAALDRPPDAG